MTDGVFVDHSVSSIIGALESIAAPQASSDLVMIGPSPCYIDDKDHVGVKAASAVARHMRDVDHLPVEKSWSTRLMFRSQNGTDLRAFSDLFI